jgi:hypothetical protein
MIIKYPTGLYKDVLPSKPEDTTSVTFYISNNAPPRTSLIYPKVPMGEAKRKRIPAPTDEVQRRASAGELLYTVTRSQRSDAGSNSKQYITGQILEFSTAPIKTADTMYVADKTEQRHDVQTFDYESIGLTTAEVQLLNDESLRQYQTLAETVNNLRMQRANAEQDISVNQRLLNEVDKNIEALQVVVENSSETDQDVLDLLAKFETRRTEIQAALDQAVTDANNYATQASATMDDLRSIATVLR